MTYITYRLSVLFLFIICILSIALLFLLFGPITVVTPNVQPYKVFTPIVKRGGDLLYQVDACKYVSVESQVYRQFVQIPSKIEYPGTQEPNNIATGCRKTNVTIQVPMYIPKGIYYLNLSVFYQVNPLRQVDYNFVTEKFQVQ